MLKANDKKALNNQADVLQFQIPPYSFYPQFCRDDVWYGIENNALAGRPNGIGQYDNGAGNIHYMAGNYFNKIAAKILSQI